MKDSSRPGHSKTTRYLRPAATESVGQLPSEVDPQPRQRAGVGRRLRYLFDNTISRRPWIVVLWLGLVTLAIAVLATLVLSLGGISGINGADPETVPEAFWQTLLRIIDTGTIANDVGWPARLVAFCVTLTGIFLAGSLIGLITNVLDRKLADLRKGTSLVLESDHTLILGWSARVPTIVHELATANANRAHGVIVVVADEDKTAMEDTIKRTVGHQGRTRIVCRSGQPWTLDALAMGNVTSARSVIVTGTSGDAETVKALLAIRTSDGEHPPVIVAELADEGLARSLEVVVGANLRTVCSDVMVAELTAQACRQRGVSAVFADLLDFEGSEIYEGRFPQLVGRTYAVACLAFPTSSVLGLGGRGGVRLNPAPETVIGEEDTIFAVSEDDSTFIVGVVPAGEPAAATAPCVGSRASGQPRRLALVGWNRLAPRVLAEMDEFMAPGTHVDVIVDPTLVDRHAIDQVITFNTNLSVVELTAGPDRLAAQIHGGGYDQAIILGLRDALPIDDADARTLLTVLALHTHPAQQADRLRTVVELLDQRNTSLARATGADDFVVSDQLTSQMMSQLSENPDLAAIFNELFRPEGCSIQLLPLIDAGPGLTFADIVVDGLRQGFTPIGLVDVATGSVRLSPRKFGPLEPSPDEQVVVVAAGT